MEERLKLVIVSPERILFEGEVELVKLPGTLGAFTVLPKHAPLISSLEKGEVEYSQKGERHTFSITGGFVEVKDNRMSVCVEQ